MCLGCVQCQNSQQSLSSFSATFLVSPVSMNTNGGTGVISGASRPPVPSWARRRGGEFVSEHSGSCTDGGAVSGPGFQSLGGSRVAPTGHCCSADLFSVHIARLQGSPSHFAVRLCTDVWRAGSHAARGSGSDVRAVWVLRRTPVWGEPLWEARSTAPRQGSLELGPRWSGSPSFPQETPTVCRSANTHCHVGLASVMESPHPCVLGAVCTIGMPVPQPLCDVRSQVAGRSAGEKNMRSCVFLEAVLRFRHPAASASLGLQGASRGHRRRVAGSQGSLAPHPGRLQTSVPPSGGCFFSVEVFLSIDGNQTCSLCL